MNQAPEADDSENGSAGGQQAPLVVPFSTLEAAVLARQAIPANWFWSYAFGELEPEQIDVMESLLSSCPEAASTMASIRLKIQQSRQNSEPAPVMESWLQKSASTLSSQFQALHDQIAALVQLTSDGIRTVAAGNGWKFAPTQLHLSSETPIETSKNHAVFLSQTGDELQLTRRSVRSCAVTLIFSGEPVLGVARLFQIQGPENDGQKKLVSSCRVENGKITFERCPAGRLRLEMPARNSLDIIVLMPPDK